MLFSVEWLRCLCPTEESPGRLAAALTARGLTVDSLAQSAGGDVLDVDIPANRPDCLGHRGLARELSAALGAPLERSPEPPRPVAVADWARVEIEDWGLCSRYAAGLVRDVRVGPSPEWVVRRLECCGLRSINNVVDASNLVLLELSQPIHFFDYERLAKGGGPPGIRVRRAHAGEGLTTLDGIERRLDPEVLVIADATQPVALAGIMGGAATEIHSGTRVVLIEAAHFRPQAVRRGARRLGLQTDASYRFERGVDAAGILAAQGLAQRLLADLAAGQPQEALVDAKEAPEAPRVLNLRYEQLERLLGFAPESRAVLLGLEALGLAPDGGTEGGVAVRVPSWRPDLEREADLVEEVARHLGYDRIPERRPATAVLETRPTAPDLEPRAQDVLAQQGFHQALGYAMIGAGEDDPFVEEGLAPAIALVNPIAEPLAHLRRSLLPGLLRAADLNQRHGSTDVRLFETGRVFLRCPSGAAPGEPTRLGLAWSGAALPSHWSSPGRAVDLFDLLGQVEHLLWSLARSTRTTRGPGAPRGFHPGQSLTWRAGNGRAVAWGGALHPDLQARHVHTLFLAEVDLEQLAEPPRQAVQYAELPRLPAVTRDLSLVLGPELPFARLLAAIQAVEAPAPVTFSVIDRYEGAPLGAGQSALTVRFTLQPLARTLTDEQTETYREALLRLLEAQLGVRIRG